MVDSRSGGVEERDSCGEKIAPRNDDRIFRRVALLYLCPILSFTSSFLRFPALEI